MTTALQTKKNAHRSHAVGIVTSVWFGLFFRRRLNGRFGFAKGPPIAPGDSFWTAKQNPVTVAIRIWVVCALQFRPSFLGTTVVLSVTQLRLSRRATTEATPENRNPR